MKKLTHLDKRGKARMVDISGKEETARAARARGEVIMSAQTLALITSGGIPKGDVLAAARVAGIMAAKQASHLLPLCHPLLLTGAKLEFWQEEGENKLHIESLVKTTGKTGAEMEALAAVSVAALTVYDMCKAVDKRIVIGNIRLVEKSGGRSGHFLAE